MENQKKRINKMENYFNEYISFLNKHKYIKVASSGSEPKDVKQSKEFNNFNINAYSKDVILTVIQTAPKNTRELKKELEIDISTGMNPRNYEGGSTVINLEYMEDVGNDLKKYKLTIHYAPENPVFDFQVNKQDSSNKSDKQYTQL